MKGGVMVVCAGANDGEAIRMAAAWREEAMA